MTQTLPRSMILGAAYTVGYRVLNLDRTAYSALTTTDVAESAVSETYYVSGGITAPE